MRWQRSLQTVDVHCEGEIGRVITGGMLDLPGATMAAKLDHLNAVDDSLRLFLTQEPRGGPAGSAVLLTPPTVAGADAGLIVLQSDQAHAMSGSNSMCAATALVETGMVTLQEPETTVLFDTASGPVRAVVACRDGRCESVSLDMPPAYVERLDETVETEAWGPVRFDVAYGGIFYALVEVRQIGLKIEPGSARALATAGVELLTLINRAHQIRHPEIPEIAGIAYVMFHDREDDGTRRNCTTLWPGRVDRSPCGTGSTSLMALLHARGEVKTGDVLETHSIIGGRFESRLLSAGPENGRETIRNRVTGRAWVYGLSQIGLDPNDPFPLGFTLTDTWGPLAGGVSGPRAVGSKRS